MYFTAKNESAYILTAFIHKKKQTIKTASTKIDIHINFNGLYGIILNVQYSIRPQNWLFFDLFEKSD